VPLKLSRILLGLVFVIRTTPLAHFVSGIHAPVRGPLLGWPDGAPIRTAAFGLVLPAVVVALLCIVRTVAALLFTAGVRTREAGLAAAAASWIVMSQDPFGFVFTLHVLTLAVLVHAFASAPLLRLFVPSIYFWAAIPKLGGAWLSGSVLRTWHGFGLGHNAIGDLLMDRLARPSAIAAVVCELALVPLLFIARTRIVGIVLAVLMHAIFEAMLHPDVFGWAMIALLAAFLPERPTTSRA
jgi:hypothetical protein